MSREFSAQLEGRVDERLRLARELHDTLLQGFQGLMLRLQALDDLLPQGEAKEELEQTLNRADHLRQVDLLRRMGQPVAALRATL